MEYSRLTNLYDIRLCSCILLYHRRVLGQNFVSTKRKKLLLGLSFRGFRILSKAKTQREREREIHVYTHTRIGSIREKTRFAPTLFDFERTTEIYALAIPSVCNKETKTRRQYMYRIRYRTPLGRQRERKKIMITIELQINKKMEKSDNEELSVFFKLNYY